MSERKVLATVAGIEITDAEVDAYISGMPQQQQAYASNPQFRAQVLNQLATIQMFAQKGIEDKLDETEEFAKILEAAKRDILAQLAIQKVVGGITVEDEEAAAYYEQNKGSFTQGESVGARHILVDDEAKCQDILAMVKSGEKSFEDAAREFSTCPSSEKGGDLGEFGRGQMVPEFDQAAFAAEVNEVTGPVKTQFGYHLIQVYKKNTAEAPAFDEVKDRVKAQLLQQKQNTAYAAALNELGQKYMA